MIILATTERLDDQITDQISKNGNAVIDFETVIQEEFEESDFDSVTEFYDQMTEDSPTHFAKQLADSWIRWIELQGVRVTDGVPDSKYLVHGIRDQRELRHIKQEFEDEVITMSMVGNENRSTLEVDVPNDKKAEYADQIVRRIVNELVID